MIMLKKYLYDEDVGSLAGSGAVNFNINVNPEALEAAATAYETAKESYNTARGEIEKALKAVLDAWDDSSKEEYEGKVALALGQLDAIATTLQDNADKLKNIAAYAAETENNVKTGVGSISVLDK